MSVYRYASLTAAGDRPGYHFAPFEGAGLLDAFTASRSALAESCGPACSAMSSGPGDDEVERQRRAFEVQGRLREGESTGALVRLWHALAERNARSADVRDVNCMLKLGDVVSQRGASDLSAAERGVVSVCVEVERRAVEGLMRRAREGLCRGCGPLKRPTREMRLEQRIPGARVEARIPGARVEARNGGGARRVGAFGMVLVESSRSRAYVSVLASWGLVPRHVVFVGGTGGKSGAAVDGFDNTTPVLDQLSALGVATTVVETGDMNDAAVVRAVSASGLDVMVYSGFPGVKVRRGLLGAGAELVHVHGGRLPDQRGSTTWYYSLLEEGFCWASAIVMNALLDGGAVVGQRAFVPTAAQRMQLDYGFDPLMRADVLRSVMERYVATGLLPRCAQPRRGRTYYVMHPVLRHVAVLAGELSWRDRGERKMRETEGVEHAA